VSETRFGVALPELGRMKAVPKHPESLHPQSFQARFSTSHLRVLYSLLYPHQMFFEGVWKNLYPPVSWVIPFNENTPNTAMQTIAFGMLETGMLKSARTVLEARPKMFKRTRIKTLLGLLRQYKAREA
jgi:hypothetical protein